MILFFFFQAEDGIRDWSVTGVQTCALPISSPTEPFLITLKFAFALGLLLASPVVIYQLWAFLTPALYPREKRLIVPALSVGVVLFLTGAAIAFEWLLPHILRRLFSLLPQLLPHLTT